MYPGCDEGGLMIEDLSSGLCVGEDPNLWDPDTHQHLYLGTGNVCWICDEAREVCNRCPVYWECFREAARIGESWMIRAGYAWTNGRPRDVRKIKRPGRPRNT